MSDDGSSPASVLLPELLSRGIPAGLVGVGVDVDACDDTTHLSTIFGTLVGTAFDAKSGGLKLTFLIPEDHCYVALPLKDVRRMQLVLRVYSRTLTTRDKYGTTAATEPTAAQNQRAMIQRRIRERHSGRRFQRAMKNWVGPDGPGDGEWAGVDDGVDDG